MIYLDNAATTALRPEALEAMMPYLTTDFGNAGAAYSLGYRAKKGIAKARKTIADTLGTQPEEIYFTSGGSEADNWAIRSVAKAKAQQGRHIITTSVEHPAVLNTCKSLEREGYDVTYLPVDEYGKIQPEQLERAIRRDTILISVMAANNEVGTRMPLEDIGALAAKNQILFHVDGVQAYGHVPLHADSLHVDLLSVSGHKFGGPKGVGFLYARKGTPLEPFVYGGGQERGLRSGTENVAGIVGMGVAADSACAGLEAEQEHLYGLRELFLQQLAGGAGDVVIHGDPKDFLPGILSVSFPGLEAESILIHMDLAGICASGGSACSSGSREPSHVLRAMGKSEAEIKGALRFSMSGANTAEEIRITVGKLKSIVNGLKGMHGI